MTKQPDDWSVERMTELGNRHAWVEAEKRLDELMDTLVAEPVYDFVIQGLRLRGGERMRRYYQQFFEDYAPRVIEGELLTQWADESAVVREDALEIRGPEGPERQRVISVLFAEGDRLGGERIYASDRVVRMMAGEMFGELEPIA